MRRSALESYHPIGFVLVKTHLFDEVSRREAEVIDVDEAIGTRVVRRIDVDALDLARVRPDQMLECIEVVYRFSDSAFVGSPLCSRSGTTTVSVRVDVRYLANDFPKNLSS